MKKSFTLLEMLIVLGIIATILSVLAVSFSTTQKKSRDAKRKGDIKAIQSGLEQYYSTCNYSYPLDTAGILAAPVSCSGNTIISIVPVDPKGGTPYVYNSDGTDFTLCTNTIESESVTGFCVQNQQ